MNLSIVVVAYNSDNFLLNCLESLYKYIDVESFEVIVSNNAYNNKLDLPNYKNLHTINNPENYGFAKALNISIKLTSGKYILVVNPDIVFNNQTIKIMYSYMVNNDNTGIVGCKVIDFNGHFQKSSRRRFPSVLNSLSFFLNLAGFNLLDYYHYDDYDTNMTAEVDSLSGCCMMFTRDIYNRISGFNENYFLYFEDTQFCIDISKQKMKVVYIHNAIVSHFGGGSTQGLSYYKRNKEFYNSLLRFFILNIYQYKMFLINCILSIIFLLILIK